MDIHNIDEYLDLQDQSQLNLLSTEELTVPEGETEWHSAPVVNSGLGDMLIDNPYLYNGPSTNTTSDTTTEWDLLQNGLDLQQGMNSYNSGDMNHFITPGSLFKQPTAVQVETPVEEEEKRVTRSRAAASGTEPKRVVTPKKKKTKAKKLYCICQQPYNGKPMVQCDYCQEWYHCACVGFDPAEDENEDGIDWACKKCIEDPTIVKHTPTETKSPNNNNKVKKEPAKTEKVTITIPARQTRSRNQSTCLYSGCNNRTRADSYCSDVCARKDREHDAVKETRKSRMRTASESTIEPVTPRSTRTNKKSVTPETKQTDEEYIKEEEEEEEEEEAPEEDDEEEEEQEKEEEGKDAKAKEGTHTPDTPMSPSQMTVQENPVRRNVIKNISAILATIIDTATKENEDLFGDDMDAMTRAEQLAKSIENTMLEQLGDIGKSQRHRTCGEPYKSKFRSLLYNLKDKQNQVFQMRVISGDLSPLELVKMSSEDMANPELKSMSEVFREKGLKNVVMKLDNTPIIKKTHKGDIIMVPNKDNDTHQNLYAEQVNTHSMDTSVKKEEEKQQHKVIDSFSPITSDNNDGSKVDPLDDILARIGIPSQDKSNKRGSLDTNGSEYTKKRKVTLNMEELLGDEDEEEPFEVEEVDTSELEREDSAEKVDKEEEKEEELLPTIWSGQINMPQVAEFEASARQIGGRLLSESEWAEVLSPTMWIEGRIPSERVTSYVTQSQYSNSREIVLLEIEPNQSPDQPNQSQTLLKYLDSRQRYAVVGHNKTKVKDFYLIPLYKVQNIPDCLYVVRVEETKRKCDLFLGVLVLAKSVTPSIAKQAPVVPHIPIVPTATSIPNNGYVTSNTHHAQQQQQAPSQYGYGYQQYNQQQQQQQSSYRYNNNNTAYNNSYRNNNNNNNNNNSSQYRPSY